jgi:hypothetical protein
MLLQHHPHASKVPKVGHIRLSSFVARSDEESSKLIGMAMELGLPLGE